MKIQEIPLFAIQGFKAGHAEDRDSGTGVSVFLFDTCSSVGVDIRGGGPASRETPLLDPQKGASGLHALVLSGGSAFGLDASGGVLAYLEEHGIGFDVGVTKVPLVCQSCIFDLTVGSAAHRPTKEMAYEACKNAVNTDFTEGCVGAGMGASVGKACGMDYAMKTGIGAYAMEIDGIQAGAVVVLNALGDIFDSKTGQKIAGVLAEDKKSFSEERTAQSELLKSLAGEQNLFTQNQEEQGVKSVTNTTLGILFTNAKFDKAGLSKLASVTHNAYARTISPVHTMADGDTIYAVSLGEKKADINALGVLCTMAMEKAIVRAVKTAEPLYGLPSYSSLFK